MAKKFTRNSFKSWLLDKSPRTKVGRTDEQDKTPVYNYLRQNNFDITSVKLPVWAQTYNQKVLARPGKTISADAALSLLG